ncbi:hypothetical protein L249_5200 [Ophiocordyceps polyrhachis-furcata BCC 54312]|uniref:Ribosomal RNA-processing protein 41 n=1 Tax=Ophiocordyceps polyrhachis-furcata BCC 54312 TaxID=1330021 RepID=A0A367L8Y7_9HYPO|nr:hypothetical protein L249_5200 [Ophiocordyceps polyrhachis-furcata BCC 54312]
MPLDTSAYGLGLLRVDGRRWNDLRRVQARLRTQDAADGSSYLEMGHTKIMGTVSGPEELLTRRGEKGGGASLLEASASVVVRIVVAGFAGVERKRRGRNDRRIQEMETTIARTFSSVIHTHLFPHSTITISLHVLSTDGSLLAALFNTATLALIDAGVPMADYVSACTAGSTSPSNESDISSSASSETDPVLDLNAQEELELPFLTLAAVGEGDKVAALVSESRLHVSLLEPLIVVGLDGCRQVRALLDGVVGERGRRLIREGVAPRGDVLFAEVEG